MSDLPTMRHGILQDGWWLLIARQWGKIPTNFQKPVGVDSSIYKDYVGQYEWRPLDNVETISVKDGRLWTQSGNEAPEELLPLGADSFFLRSDLGINKFAREPNGRITGNTETSCNWHWREGSIRVR